MGALGMPDPPLIDQAPTPPIPGHVRDSPLQWLRDTERRAVLTDTQFARHPCRRRFPSDPIFPSGPMRMCPSGTRTVECNGSTAIPTGGVRLGGLALAADEKGEGHAPAI